MKREAKGALARSGTRVPALETFIVDYDLPADLRRKRFYRAVRRHLREHDLPETGWSTWSTIFTEDEDFAWLVHDEALACGGQAHVWRATWLSERGTGETRDQG